MTDDPKNPDLGQAPVIPDPELEVTPTDPKEPSEKVDPKDPAKRQDDFVPMRDYKELQGEFTRDRQKRIELEKKVSEYEATQAKLQQAFNPSAQATPGQAGEELMTSKQLRAEEKRYRDAGLDFEAKSLGVQAAQAEVIEKISGTFSHQNEVNEIYTELSKEGSLVKPGELNWKEIGEMRVKDNVPMKYAAAEWIRQNLTNVVNPLLEKERETLTQANRARGLEGDIDLQMTDAEKKQEEKDRASIGDPRQWKT